MLYLFCYVLRVKSFVSRGAGAGEQEQQRKDFQDDGFDVDDFIRRMTLATGLDVKEVQSADGTDNCRLSIAPKTLRGDREG